MTWLRELDARFMTYHVKPNVLMWIADGAASRGADFPKGFHKERRPQVYMHVVDILSEAQGVEFLCPRCFAENKGPVGTHRVICWSRSRGVPEDAVPGPGRWKMDGNTLDDLTLNGDAVGGGGARSVLLTGGCGWHGFVTEGDAA